VAAHAPRHDPWACLAADEEIREAFDLIAGGHFNFEEPGIFDPITHALTDGGDPYLNLADLRAYIDTHDRVDDLYRQPHEWARRAILNVAYSGKFSSDRTIAEYAREIWQVEPCPIENACHDAPQPEEAQAQVVG